MPDSELSFSPVTGIRLGSAAAAIKYSDRDDLVVVEIAEGSRCAALFTQNLFCAAPVVVAKQHLAATAPHYLLINSGNANAGTGDEGLRATREACRALAAARGCAINQILPFSTGVIGETLPVIRIASAIPETLMALGEQGWARAAQAIMTTDTQPKLVSRSFSCQGQTYTVTGMAKGSGMIRPDMATMLAFLATDAKVDQPLLQRCLQQAVAPSFNAITVDGDTSTNDACVLIATGGAQGDLIEDSEAVAYRSLCDCVREVCMVLARAIVKDGEGATKLVTVAVQQAATTECARAVAYTIAESPLVKTALFASDPNWGRILAAVGRAGVALDIESVEIWLDQLCIVRGGGRADDYSEAAGAAVMAQDEFTICVDLGQGDASAEVLTCDLSYDYVKINAEYRT